MNLLYARRFFAGVAVATSRKGNDADKDSGKNKVLLITNRYTSRPYLYSFRDTCWQHPRTSFLSDKDFLH